MKSKVSNGWHKVAYGEVFVDNGYAYKVRTESGPMELHRTDLDSIGRLGIRVKLPLKFETVKKGIYNGTYTIDIPYSKW